MTSVTQLRIAGGAGEPDSIGACRLDVVIAAEALYDAQLGLTGEWSLEDLHRRDDAEIALSTAVERLRKARRDAAEQRGIR